MTNPVKKDVLIISLGGTPQIITETLWWIIKGSDPGIVPNKIIFLTTTFGKGIVQKHFSGKDDNKLTEFWEYFSIRDKIPEMEIVVTEDNDTSDLSSNIDFANVATRKLQELTNKPDTRIHTLITGGRKTMSFYLGHAMSMLARPTDRLLHVLVEPEYEDTNFWWPDKSDTINTPVRVTEIPFVRLRNKVPKNILNKKFDYNSTVSTIQDNLPETLKLILHDDGCKIEANNEVNNEVVKLGPKEYALYRLLAEVRKSNKDTGAGPDGIGKEHKGWLKRSDMQDYEQLHVKLFLEMYQDTGDADTLEENYKRNYEKDENEKTLRDIDQVRAKLQISLEKKFKSYILRNNCEIKSEGRNPARFGLLIKPENIEIKERF